MENVRLTILIRINRRTNFNLIDFCAFPGLFHYPLFAYSQPCPVSLFLPLSANPLFDIYYNRRNVTCSLPRARERASTERVHRITT